ncbi:ribonuclease III [Azonexus sp.]|uniref:ribonuclease III n=1 Tax=Azonexus sp. TaxID=1872668 RepID=UPI0035B42023
MTTPTVAQKLGHRFSDPQLLRTALTHRSFGVPNNERLEFLGDGVLDFVIAEALYQRFPNLPEGDLSRLRANLVRQDTLHGLAQQLDIGRHLRLGEGELRSGGATRPSILADALEAVLGAIHLDAGFAAVQAVILTLYAPLLDALKPGNFQKDAKTRLQEWLQGRKKPLPRYELVEASGAAHEQRFTVACLIDNPSLRTVGAGTSRRIAEQAAAEQALKELNA